MPEVVIGNKKMVVSSALAAALVKMSKAKIVEAEELQQEGEDKPKRGYKRKDMTAETKEA